MRSIAVSGWVVLLCAGAGMAETNGWPQAWPSAEQAAAAGETDAAVRQFAGIATQAIKREAWAEAVKAVVRQTDLETERHGAAPGALWTALCERCDRSPGPMRPFMELLTAHYCWRFFLEHRDALRHRSAGPADRDEAIAAWSSPRILREIENRFQRALAYEKLLKEIPVGAFDGLLKKGTVSDACRPTLYDFIAYEMIDFYSLGGRAGVQWADDFTLSADMPALSDLHDFMFLIPDEAAARSHVLRALRLFQDLLRFHEKDSDPSAYLDANLSRLQFSYHQVTGPGRDTRYAEALDRFANAWRTHEISARAWALRAQLAFDRGDYGVAKMFAQNGAATYPHSIGAAQCRNLVTRIEASSVAFEAERMWCAPWPVMTITYRNLPEVQFRAVAVPFAEMFAVKPRSDAETAAYAVSLLQRPSAKTWTVTLPPVPDHKENRFNAPVPKDLRPGLYAVFASVDGTFVKEGKPLSWSVFRVSKLALAVESCPDRLRGWVLTADAGLPVDAAQIEIWRRDRDDQRYRRVQTIRSGADGAFSVLGEWADDVLLYVEKQGQAAQTWSPVWKGNERERSREAGQHVIFLTDRGAYRPGETVQYKGIRFLTDTQNGRCHTAADRTVTVELLDAARHPVDRQTVKSNGYGSFSGRFALPKTAAGEMTVGVGGMGQAAFSVGDCRTPAFDVTLAPARPGARLGSVVSVSGQALFHDGVPLAGAHVAWRVLCSRTPSEAAGDCCLAAEPPRMIAHGTAVSDVAGGFAISFFAQPHDAIAGNTPSAFDFRVIAEVSDMTGEAHTGCQRMTLGSEEWLAEVTCGAWTTAGTPVALNVRVCTPDGDPVMAAGDVTVFAVRQPGCVRRPPEPAAVSAEAGTGNPETWPDVNTVKTVHVAAGTNGMAACRLPLDAGLYRVRFSTRDPSGHPVEAHRLIRVIDPDAKRYPIREPFFFAAESWRLEPGDTFRAIWGSGYEHAYAVVTVEQNGRELMRVRTAPDETQRKIEFPVTEAMRGDVWVKVLSVRENRPYTVSRRLEVPWSNKRLSLQWRRFSSRLEPGQPETWQAVLTDDRGAPAAAEIGAVLYDASRDTGRPQRWPASFEAFFNRCEAEGTVMFQNGPAAFAPLFGAWPRVSEPDIRRYRTWPAEVGRDRAGRWLGPDRAASMAWPAAPEQAAHSAATSAAPDAQDGKTEPLNAAADRGNDPIEDGPGTAFFLPHVATAADGTATLSFTAPEVSAPWRLLVFAHDPALRSGCWETGVETVKSLTVKVDPPHFVRAGDRIGFAVQLANRTAQPLEGQLQLHFQDAATSRCVDASLGVEQTDRPFRLDAGGMRTEIWRLRIPDGTGTLRFRVAGAAGAFKDGKDGTLPVLPRCAATQETARASTPGKKASGLSALRKRFFVRLPTPQGLVLQPAEGVLPQGAEVVTRLDVYAECGLTDVQVRDRRPACLAAAGAGPYDVHQDGWTYRVRQSDSETQFSADFLPKGAHVFESSGRLRWKGVFCGGQAEAFSREHPDSVIRAEGPALRVGTD